MSTQQCLRWGCPHRRRHGAPRYHGYCCNACSNGYAEHTSNCTGYQRRDSRSRSSIVLLHSDPPASSSSSAWFDQGHLQPSRLQSTARTEARQNFGALITPAVAAPSMPSRVESTAAPSGDYNQTTEMQQLRAQNQQQRAHRATALAMHPPGGRVHAWNEQPPIDPWTDARQTLDVRPQRNRQFGEPVRETARGDDAAPAAVREPRVWDGPEYTCSICQEDMVEHDRVCRLRCRHVFHTQCWERMLHATDATTCPICRAEAGISAIWHFVGPRQEPTQGQPNLLHIDDLVGSAHIPGLSTQR